MNFLGGVNRVLRANGVIRGDTDAVITFSDLQHGATLNLAIIAIQDELNELIADSVLPYEKDATGSITTVAGTRSYALPEDFVRFFGIPSLYDSTTNGLIYEYPFGEAALRNLHPDYQTVESLPSHWYFDLTTTKKLGFWYVPSEARTYTFLYEKSVAVTDSTDTLPFHTESEAQAFCRLASRRFKMLYEEMDPALIANDPERNSAKATLFSLIVGKSPSRRWAPVYR